MLEGFRQFMVNRPIANLLDIIIIWFIIYQLLLYARGTQMMNLLKGVGIFFAAKILSSMIGLQTLDWFLGQILSWGVVAAIILFQPELRRFLEVMGRTFFRNRRNRINANKRLIDHLETALLYMSRRKIGALISIEGEDGLGEYADTGIELDSEISSQLLINIFIPNTPLHDGAVIIRHYRIAAASCYLPLSESDQISKELGTRHRAAIGLSEVTDALTLIVSEETGDISLAKGIHFHRGIAPENLKAMLELYLKTEDNSENDESQSMKWIEQVKHYSRRLFKVKGEDDE